MNGRNKFILLAALAALTLALLAGIKFIMKDSDTGPAPVAAEPQPIFGASADEAPPPELNPLSRPVNASGGGLDMFSKTNAGYYGEDEEEEAVPAAPAPKAKTPGPAGPAVKKAAAKPKAKTTTIPRMNVTPFKSITPTTISPSGAGGQQGMPDLSTIMKQAQEQAGQTNPD